MNGHIGSRISDGVWWSMTSGSSAYGHYFGSSPTAMVPRNSYYRGLGMAIRWGVRILILFVIFLVL